VNAEQIVERGRRVVRLEREALALVEERLGDAFANAVLLIAAATGRVIVAGADRRLHGVLTAGDLTRLMEHEADVLAHPVERIMTRAPRTARVGELASAVTYRMEANGVMAMPVLDGDDLLAGVVHLHDLMRARVA
jgi:arabinose-5-phosphate isomerase